MRIWQNTPIFTLGSPLEYSSMSLVVNTCSLALFCSRQTLLKFSPRLYSFPSSRDFIYTHSFTVSSKYMKTLNPIESLKQWGHEDT